MPSSQTHQTRKNQPRKTVKWSNPSKKTKENYDLLADSYFLLKDRVIGIEYLIKSLGIDNDPDTAFKIGRFAFEEENWDLAYTYLKRAKDLKYKKTPGRLDLLMGICKYESNDYKTASKLFNNALDFEATKTSAEGWLLYLENLQAS